jgi:predicted acyltransferase
MKAFLKTTNFILTFYLLIKLMQPQQPNLQSSQRLLSLDFLRGFIMIFLALESCGLYDHLFDATKQEPILNNLFLQFFHHPWNGLRFWDLIQPSFMFMAGVSLAFSLTKQYSQGVTWSQSFKKTLKRCFWLFFWGVLDYSVRKTGLSFELWDVLTQLSFTTFVAFLIFKWNVKWQILVCVGLLLLTEALYRFTNVPNFNQPFVDQHNFGNYADLLLMNKINKDGWVAINCIPTAVHTIAGTIVGKLLISGNNKIKTLLIWAAICFALGFGLDYAHITPIIKRTATSSFILASLGWCLCFLTISYWWIDIKNHKKYLQFFTIVGMNSIFIYLFFEIVGDRWFTVYISTISNGLMSFINTPETLKLILSSFTVFTLAWLLCYFLYKKKIFFKL